MIRPHPCFTRTYTRFPDLTLFRTRRCRAFKHDAERHAAMTVLPPKVRPGLTGRAELVVGTNDTASRVGSGRVAVLATPVMIGVIAAAALAAVERSAERRVGKEGGSTCESRRLSYH